MKRNFNWGIIGLGHIARKFAEDLQTIPNTCLLAVASQSKERASIFAEKFNVLQHYGSYEEIINCPELDAIYIATPHVSHCSNAILCLKNRIPVLCEKPFAMNSQEVRQMIAVAKGTDTFLMEALWTRFLPSIKKSIGNH